MSTKPVEIKTEPTNESSDGDSPPDDLAVTDDKGQDTDGLFEDTDEEVEESEAGDEAEDTEEEGQDAEDDDKYEEEETDDENAEEGDLEQEEGARSFYDRIKALEIMLSNQATSIAEYKKKSRARQQQDTKIIRSLQGRIRTAQNKINAKNEKLKALPSELKAKFDGQHDRAVAVQKRKVETLQGKLDESRKEVKRLKRCETQAVLSDEKQREMRLEISRLRSSNCEKQRELTKNKRTIEQLEKKVARHDESKLQAMKDCAQKQLAKNIASLEKEKVKLQQKDKDYELKSKEMAQRALYRNQSKATDQYVKDLSAARKAEQNHAYAMEYCKLHNHTPSKTKIVDGHFAKINEPLRKDTPHLSDAYEILMQKKEQKASEAVTKSRKKLRDIANKIAKVDKMKPLKHQPALDKFITPKGKENKKSPPKAIEPAPEVAIVPAVATLPTITQDDISDDDDAVAPVAEIAVHGEYNFGTSQMTEKKNSPFPGWKVVVDDFSKSTFFEHAVTGEISFASPHVDPRAIAITQNEATIDPLLDDDDDDKKMPAKKLDF